jgi:hypothetical protein
VLYAQFSKPVYKAAFQLVDLAGRLVFETSIWPDETNRAMLNIGQLTPGGYMLLIQTAADVQRKKIIIGQ